MPAAFQKNVLLAKRLWSCTFALLLLMCFGVPADVSGQGLKVVGKLKVESGSLKGAKVVILKDGKKIRTLTEDLAKFEFTMKPNSNYMMSFEKDGYVTKKLQFNTQVPSSGAEKEYAPFGFTVNLFEQYDDVNLVVFNQPVGKIGYEADIEEFDYDTDYTKSIQSALSEAMKEVEKAKKEAEKQAKKDEKDKAKLEAQAAKEAELEEKRKEAELLAAQKAKKETEKAEQEEVAADVEVAIAPEPEPTPVAKPEPEPVKVEKPRFVAPNVDMAPANSGSESRNSISAVEGFENSPVKPAKAVSGFEEPEQMETKEEDVERFEDVFVEKTKIITKVRYVAPTLTTEYLKVYHKWGGTFYFKNGKSCSQQVFELETLGHDMVSED